MIMFPKVGQICQLKANAWMCELSNGNYRPVEINSKYDLFATVVEEPKTYRDNLYIKLRDVRSFKLFYCNVGDILYEELY